MAKFVRWILCALTSLGSFAAGSNLVFAEGNEVLLDRIVGVVDGYPILYSEVMKKVEKGPLVAISYYPADEKASPYQQALQDTINFELIMQRARDLEIDVNDSEVEAEISKFIAGKGLSHEALLEYLQGQGQTYEDYKADFRNQLLVVRFQGRVIAPLVKVTDKDVETYYLKKAGSASDLVELVLRQIVIKVDATAAADVIEAKRKVAEEVHQKLTDGMSFEDAVKIYSDDASARSNGGLMTGIKLKDLAGPIRSQVESIDVDQFTAPVRTAMGFHLFYLEEKRFANTQAFKGEKDRLAMELRSVEVMNQTRRWLAEQRQKAKVQIID